MEKHSYLFRYGLTITGAERGEWQGLLENDGEIREFKSVIELLRLIRQDELELKNPPAGNLTLSEK